MTQPEYSSPEKFNPDRWLNNKYGTINNENTAQYEREQRKLTYS